jgi:hypothetical protein
VNTQERFKLTRRDLLRLSILTGGATLIGARGAFAQGVCIEPPQPHAIEPGFGIGVGGEAFPTSPFILDPFTQPLPIPKAMAPVANPAAMTVRRYTANGITHEGGSYLYPPGDGRGQQDSWGDRFNGPGIPQAGTHQLWPTWTNTGLPGFPLPAPIVYHLKLKVGTHQFTTSAVLPIDAGGNPVVPPDGIAGPRLLPASTIYGFSQFDPAVGDYVARFPGALINAEYGHPVLVRFENELDLNPLNLSRNDFGAPDWAFLTHLHNGHTAPESDGQPNHMSLNNGGYVPGDCEQRRVRPGRLVRQPLPQLVVQ